MRRLTTCFAVLLTTIAMSLACGRDSPTGPSRPTMPSSAFVGVWSGSLVDSVDGAGTLEMAITEHVAISLLGSWASRFADASRNDNGLVTGSVDGATVRVMLQSTSRPCAPLITATLTVDGARMTGGYITLACGTARDGRIELTKR